MHLRRRIGALCFVLFAAASFPACAQTSATPDAPSNSNAAATPAQAQQTLDILQDPARRAALIETLQTITKASAATPAATKSPPAPATAKPATSTLVAGGVGAQLLLAASREIDDVSREFTLGGGSAAN